MADYERSLWVWWAFAFEMRAGAGTLRLHMFSVKKMSKINNNIIICSTEANPIGSLIQLKWL